MLITGEPHYFWTSEELDENHSVMYNRKTKVPFHEANKLYPLPVVLVMIPFEKD